MRKAICIIALLIAFILAGAAYAEEMKDTSDGIHTYSMEKLADSNSLAEGYIRQAMGTGRKTVYPRGNASAGSGLNGAEAAVYGLLRSDIALIANGSRTATVMQYPASAVYGKTDFTADDFEGISVIIADGEITPEAQEAMEQIVKIDFQLVLEALICDCPYDLYWFNNPGGISIEYPVPVITDETTISIEGDLVVSFQVSADYALNDNVYECNPIYGQSVMAAAQNAGSIVQEYSDASDRGKLAGYAIEICVLTEYNYEALGETVPYGNPWQMIWVFDGNTKTNVVCEGYSKAFQYLCDLTDFSDPSIHVITVSGTLSENAGHSEEHMWNIVHLGDGKNYLADITNIDTGTAVFLAESISGDYQNGYVYRNNYGTLTYQYSNTIRSLYTENELTMALISSSLTTVEINEANFPDQVFREYVQSNFDLNGDRILDESERVSVQTIDVNEYGNITSLKGIEVFPELIGLYAWRNQITAVDLSHNPFLAYVYLSYNQISVIDVTSLAYLNYLDLEENPISSIDVSQNALLEGLYIQYTNIASIDTSHNPHLKVLDCQSTGIQDLDVRKNTRLCQLICQNLSITSIDLSRNAALTSLWISNTKLKSLDLSNNPGLHELFCAHNPLTHLDLTHNPFMDDLRADCICVVLPSDTQEYNMTSFDGFIPQRSSDWEGAQFNYDTGILTNITEKTVRYKYDCGNGMSITVTLYFTNEVPVTSAFFPDPVFRQYVLENFAENGVLTPEQLCHVTDIHVGLMGITSLKGIELFPNLINLYCDGNQITELNLNTHNLLNLIAPNTQISQLNIGYQPTLSYLDISNCPISSIDLSVCPNLDVLYCGGTELEELDVQTCKNLTVLSCDCRLTELDLTGLPVDSNHVSNSTEKKVTVFRAGDFYIAESPLFLSSPERAYYTACTGRDPVTGTALYTELDFNYFKDNYDNCRIEYTYDTGLEDFVMTVYCPYEVGEISTLVIPSGIIRINAEAFRGTAAMAIVIPAGCISVAEDAFTDCRNLKYIVNCSDCAVTAPEGVIVLNAD